MFSSLFGRQGDNGEQGEQGVQGEQGIQGIQGETGSSGLVDNGDLAAKSFTLGDLTTDGTWNELDLSAKVPEGAYAVELQVEITDDVAGNVINIRKVGYSNAHNLLSVVTQVGNVMNTGRGVVFLDENRKLAYAASNTTFTVINITICNYYTV